MVFDFAEGSYVNYNGWRFQRLKNNYIKAYYIGTTDNQIPQTAGDVVTKFVVPFMCRLINMRLYHTTSLHVANNTNMAIKLQRSQGIPLYETETIVESLFWDKAHFRWNGGLGWEFEPSTFTLTLNTDNEDRVTPVFLLQNLEL